MIDLIILDMIGTILNPSEVSTPRNGFLEFLERYKNKKFAISTDATLDYVKEILTNLEVCDKFDKIYTRDNLIEVRDEIKGVKRKSKNLKKICEDFNISTENTVMITDGGPEIYDAKKDSIKLLKVPYYHEKDEKFSFDLISPDFLENLPMYLDLEKNSSDF